MTDLEEHALRRDRRFLWRLISGLLLALMAGLFLFARLTSESMAGCAAEAFLGQKAEQSGQP
jgi:hypothetical protein